MATIDRFSHLSSSIPDFALFSHVWVCFCLLLLYLWILPLLTFGSFGRIRYRKSSVMEAETEVRQGSRGGFCFLLIALPLKSSAIAKSEKPKDTQVGEV